MRFVAVTACPTGIAQAYLAAAQLEKAARKLGHVIKVETQGAVGIENQLSQAEVDNADGVIIASDIPVEHGGRFLKAPRVTQVPVQLALKSPETIFVRLQCQAA
ncbi:MAG TPA: fructose PTS transporter subunit IIB [Verrucomicrobiae bacterium]|nr:fructose PTS transporter subunit IIB [Verrucomicrobiae bacterium]